MTDTFNEREKAFENKFKLDEEMRFKIRAKAVKLFGLWVAGHLGLKSTDAETYARKIVDTDIDVPNVGSIVLKAQKDLEEKNIVMTERHMHNQFNAHQEQARQQLMRHI